MKNLIKFCLTGLLYVIINLMFFKTMAQVPVVNTNVPVVINPSTSLFINGSLTQENIATIENDGTLLLSGDFTNNATNNCFGTSAGTVILTGGNQNIGGTGITAFNNLTLGGSGIKKLTSDIQVGGANGINSGILNLGIRILDLNSQNLTITNRFPSAITRVNGQIASETNSVTGYGIVKWNIGLSAAGSNFEFPFGDLSGTSYHPFNFIVNSPGTLFPIGSLTGGSVSVSTHPTFTAAAPNNRPLPLGVTHLDNVTGTDNSKQVIDRYWVMNVAGYLINPTASMIMTYRTSEHDASAGSTNNIVESQLTAQQWNGSQWLSQTGSVNIAANKVSVTGVKSFNTVWTLVSSSSPLPVELLSFNAILNSDKMVDLVWETASELNNDYFTMERSSDGITFENIGNVDGAGNSTIKISYAGLDPKPFSGISYYRLKQTDFDGAFTYSQVVTVNLSSETPGAISMTVYPNPTTDQVNIQVNDGNLSMQSTVEIYNGLGQVVFSSLLANMATFNNSVFQVKTENFPAGIYILRLMNANEIIASQKLIIK